MFDKAYKITCHSFIDLITNSSTEIYIQATAKTVEAISSLIDSILKLAGSNLKCGDLFKIEIDKENFKKDYDGYENSDYDKWIEHHDCEDYRNVYLLVKNVDPNDELAKQTAKVLSNLTGLFQMEAIQNM